MSDIQQRTEALLVKSGALREGHFLLSSGRHSDRYCQCARLFEFPDMAEQVATMMIGNIPEDMKPTIVMAPALGGILWGYELARQLGLRSIFAERTPEGEFALRRGFELGPGDRVLLAEDVITTGKSVCELIPLIRQAGAQLVGFAAVADRSMGAFQPPQPLVALAQLNFQTWEAGECPLCAQGGIAEKPGSRKQ